MQTMMTTIKRGRDVWDPINMPESEFKERIKHIQAEMGKRNISVLLVYGSGPDEYGDPCYITNFVPKLGANIALIPQNGKVTLTFNGSARGIEYEQATTWVKDFRPSGDTVKECLKYLKDNQFSSSSTTIGLVGFKDKMPFSQLQALYAGCGQSNVVDAEEIIKSFRAIKSSKEQDQIRRSARILNHILGIATATTFTNLDERKVEAVIDKEARLEGAEDFRMLVAKPREARWAFRPVESQPLSSGDIIILYAAVAWERYWADCIRTFKIEDSRLLLVDQPDFSELYRQVLQGLQPGKAISTFCRDTQAELQKRKIKYVAVYGLGQGIGLSPNEMPVLSEGETGLIKRGMCIAFRLGVEDNTLGAVMLGDTICLD